MERLLPLLLMLPFVLLAFWLWMAWDMANNGQLSEKEKVNWLLAFLFLNVFAAVFYYVTEYRKRS